MIKTISSLIKTAYAHIRALAQIPTDTKAEQEADKIFSLAKKPFIQKPLAVKEKGPTRKNNEF